MMKYHNSAFIFLILLSSIASCSEDTDNNPEVPQNIINNSLEFFEGEVIDKSLENDDGLEKWKVNIQNNEGSVVKFYWTVIGQKLIKMHGETGPFDYEIVPKNGLITFSTAQTIAKGAVKNDKVVSWELQQDEDFINKWIYLFEFDKDGKNGMVYIDAENGDILRTD